MAVTDHSVSSSAPIKLLLMPTTRTDLHIKSTLSHTGTAPAATMSFISSFEGGAIQLRHFGTEVQR